MCRLLAKYAEKLNRKVTPIPHFFTLLGLSEGIVT